MKLKLQLNLERHMNVYILGPLTQIYKSTFAFHYMRNYVHFGIGNEEEREKIF